MSWFINLFSLSHTPCTLNIDATSVKEAESEAGIHRAISHPNVLPLFGCDTLPMEKGVAGRQVLMLFPYCPGGSIFDIVWEAEEAGGSIPWPFSEQCALHIFLGICRGTLAMHKKGYAHLDIKPHNVLLSGDEEDRIEDKTPILMDLGSAGPLVVKVKSRSQALMIQDEAASKCSLPYRFVIYCITLITLR